MAEDRLGGTGLGSLGGAWLRLLNASKGRLERTPKGGYSFNLKLVSLPLLGGV